jgi:cell division protein FtsB
VTLKRALIAIGVLAVVTFALQGGEYGTTDLLRQRVRERALRAALDSLQRTVDSLEAYKKAVANDPVVQERIVREEFGMVRGDKEILYRLATPDTSVERSARP